MKYDHYESGIDIHALIVWIWLIIATVCLVVIAIVLFNILNRMTSIESHNGPETQTEWALVNGKIVLTQSPYSGVYFQTDSGKKYLQIYNLQIVP